MNGSRSTHAARIRAGLRAIFGAVLFQATLAMSAPLELLVPAYFYPEGRGLTYWNNLTSAAAKAPITAILNPDSGPGASIDPAYTAVVTKARAAGVKLIGYVHTSYGARPLADVVGDINRYMAFYPVDGIFIDEMTNDDQAANINYYASVYQTIKALNPSLKVIGNPGTRAAEIYWLLPAADAVVTFESGPREYRRYQADPWVGAHSNDRFGHLVHDVGTIDTARTFLNLARDRNAGLVYITNDRGAGDPWDTLPGYWSLLVSEVCKRNGGAGC